MTADAVINGGLCRIGIFEAQGPGVQTRPPLLETDAQEAFGMSDIPQGAVWWVCSKEARDRIIAAVREEPVDRDELSPIWTTPI